MSVEKQGLEADGRDPTGRKVYTARESESDLQLVELSSDTGRISTGTAYRLEICFRKWEHTIWQRERVLEVLRAYEGGVTGENNQTYYRCEVTAGDGVTRFSK